MPGLRQFVAASLGLSFPEERSRDLERGVRGAASELGFRDPASFAQWLLANEPERRHLETLASHLTIGETYFFRESASLDCFQRRIIPDLLASREAGERHLRIWTAGCCTGEEPYTIAMILDRLVPADEWTVTLLATDINPRFLRKAAGGIYGEWSFRATPPPLRDRYFRRRSDGRYELDPRIRGMVTFSYLNLAEDVFPSLMNNTNAMDVIFCRNVLMYFTPERAREVARKFHASLVEGGWLIVSPVETSSDLFSAYSVVHAEGAVVYRKERTSLSAGEAPAPPQAEIERPRFRASAPSKRPSPRRPEPPAVREESPAPMSGGHAFAAESRRCANEGKLAEAAGWCEKAIAADKMNPLFHYLLSAIRLEQGEIEAATRSLTRSLYLDPDFVLAHFGLANIELGHGSRAGAERHLRNTLAALRRHADDELLPEADGLSAGRLGEIARSLLSALQPGEVADATGSVPS
ncbi:MAG TPA: CheR family methyltransferase [Thermoanaerobaculia bacterium]|nr:CheR family methyltransferase [Thermoanaerobaculia bacterium]